MQPTVWHLLALRKPKENFSAFSKRDQSKWYSFDGGLNVPRYSSGQPKLTSFIVAERLVEIVQFLRKIFSFEKGVDCAFFGIYS